MSNLKLPCNAKSLVIATCTWAGCLLVGCDGLPNSSPETLIHLQVDNDPLSGPVATGAGLGASKRLQVRWRELDSDLMRSVAAQPELLELRILTSTRDGTPILREIAKLERLESLYLFEVPLADAELASLAKMKHLKYLELCNTGITGDGLQFLDEVPLERLTIRESGLISTGLGGIQTFAELKSLELSIPSFHVSNIPSFAGLSNLTSVSISGGHFSYRMHGGLNCLVGADSIRQLALSGKNINDRTLQAVSQLRYLERLEIGNSLISEDGVCSLAGLKNLQSLFLEGIDHIPEPTFVGLSESTDPPVLTTPS